MNLENVSGYISQSATGVTITAGVFSIGNMIAVCSLMVAIIFGYLNWMINKKRLEKESAAHKKSVIRSFISQIEDAKTREEALKLFDSEQIKERRNMPS